MNKQYLLLSIAGMFDSQEETKEENNETFHNEAKLQKERK